MQLSLIQGSRACVSPWLCLLGHKPWRPGCRQWSSGRVSHNWGATGYSMFGKTQNITSSLSEKLMATLNSVMQSKVPGIPTDWWSHTRDTALQCLLLHSALYAKQKKYLVSGILAEIHFWSQKLWLMHSRQLALRRILHVYSPKSCRTLVAMVLSCECAWGTGRWEGAFLLFQTPLRNGCGFTKSRCGKQIRAPSYEFCICPLD